MPGKKPIERVYDYYCFKCRKKFTATYSGAGVSCPGCDRMIHVVRTDHPLYNLRGKI